MPKRHKTLTLEQIEKARLLRDTPRQILANGGGMRTMKHMCPRLIAHTMGVSEYAVRRALGIAYVELSVPRDGMEQINIPPEVLLERDRNYELMLEHIPTLSEIFFGDPPPWRSALGRPCYEARQNP